MSHHDELYDEDGNIRKEIHDSHHEEIHQRKKFWGEVKRTVLKSIAVMVIVSLFSVVGVALKEYVKKWLLQ